MLTKISISQHYSERLRGNLRVPIIVKNGGRIQKCLFFKEMFLIYILSLIMQMCLCGTSVYECGYSQCPELLNPPETRLPGTCDLHDMGAGK